MSSDLVVENSNQNHCNGNSNDSNDFNPLVLYDSFKRSLKKSNDSCHDFDDVGIEEYIEAYREINKFLGCLGSIFYFGL